MLEKNALEWLDMGEGLEKLDIYKKEKISYIYAFFKILLKENDFPLYFYIILQSVFYLQLLCIIVEKDQNNDSNDYLIYIILYMSKAFLPQKIINNINSFRIMMIIISILSFALLSGFFIIFLGMKNDKNFKSIIVIINIIIRIIFNYLMGPIIIICLIPFNCSLEFNSLINNVCLTKGNDIIFIMLGLINLIFYLFILAFFSIFYKEIGKIGNYNPEIQIKTNFELYRQISKIIIFTIYFIFNTFLENKQIYIIIYHSTILLILILFSYYIYRNIFFYDKIMNITIYLGAFLVLWFSLIQILKDIFNFNQLSLFVLIGWIIIIISTINLFNHNYSQFLLDTNILEIENIKDIEMLIHYILEFIHEQEGTNKTILFGFYYRFNEYLLTNAEMKEKYNYLSNAEYLKKTYFNKSIRNGYYIIFLLYDYYLSQNKSSKFLNIHFCYFLINYLNNMVSAIYRCSNIKTESYSLFYHKYLLSENIKDYLVELNEVNNDKNSVKNVQFSSVILYYLYQNLIRIKISDMVENLMGYFGLFDNIKNAHSGSKSDLEFLKIGKRIITIRNEIKQIWDKIIILNPFCLEIRREYLSYIKEILYDDIYYEKELKYHNSLINSN